MREVWYFDFLLVQAVHIKIFVVVKGYLVYNEVKTLKLFSRPYVGRK